MDPSTLSAIMAILGGTGGTPGASVVSGVGKKFGRVTNPLMSVTGSGLSYYGQEENDVLSSLAGGFLSGAAKGASKGPLAAILSAGIGAGTEGLSTINRIEKEQILDESTSLNDLYASGVLKAGGYADDNDENTIVSPWQLELGEVVVTDENYIYKSHADRLHTEMDPNEVTDLLEDTTYVFPSQENISEDELQSVVGYSVGSYSEGAKNYALEKLILADYLGNESIPYSEALLKIEKDFEVKDNPIGVSIIDDITDNENLKARRPILQVLKMLNEAKRESRKMADTDIKPVGHMATGGSPFSAFSTIGSINFSDPNSVNKAKYNIDDPGSIYDQIEDRFGQAEFNAYDSARTGNERLDEVLGNVKSNDLSSLLVSGAALGFQNPTVKPKLKRPYLIEDRFRGMSPQEILAMVQNPMGTGVELIKALNSTGSDSMTSKLAPILYSRLLSQSGDAQMRLIQRNADLRKGKLDEVAGIQNENDISRIEAQNETNDGKRKKMASASHLYGNFIDKQNKMEAAEFMSRQSIDKELSSALDTIGSGRIDLSALKVQSEIAAAELEQRRADLKELMERTKGDN